MEMIGGLLIKYSIFYSCEGGFNLMNNGKPEYSKRPEKRQRYQAKKPRKKMDRLLNVLIAIVSILIVLNLVSIFTGDDEKQNTKETKQVTESKKNEKSKDVVTDKSEKKETTNTDYSTENMFNENENNHIVSVSEYLVQPSSDPIVDEVIINPNWQVTPTKQTGEHVSTYQEGHIDYEEKKETFRNAVGLSEEEVIYWSVKNNGDVNSSVAVISSNDTNRTNKYRIYIEWIDHQGWKPVKVEKLNQLANAY